MPIYEYRCKTCGSTRSTSKPQNAIACACGDNAKRVWGFRMARVMHEHFNATTGTVISDQRQFEADLRRKSEEATERTGIPHNYVPADPRDTKTLRVTDEGLQQTYDRQVGTGELERGTKPWQL